MITHVVGDLFEVPDLDAVAHGVNCAGVMGAGIALEFRRRWPAMFDAYKAECRAGNLRLGDVFSWPVDGRWIYNLATQLRPGPGASIWAIESALRNMLFRAQNVGVRRVGMPRIGCGLGGLAWRDVRCVIEAVAAASPIDLVVVSLPGDP